MLKHRGIQWLGMLTLLFVASGADCPRRMWWAAPAPPAPVVFNNEPTLADVVNVVNTNRSLATSLYANNVALSGGALTSLRGQLAIGSPRLVRLRAGTSFSGPELDLGSNDEQFWIWIKRSQQPTMIVGRHDTLAASPLGQTFPIRPEWLVEAIGLVYLDPQAGHVGPIRRPDGKLEIHTPIATAAGQNTKVLVLDGRSGLIYEQHWLDARGQKIASAVAARHYRDPLSSLILPRETTLTWASMPMTLKVELNEVRVNPVQISAEQWTKPQYAGYTEVDVSTLTGVGPAGPVVRPPGMLPPAAMNGQPGVSAERPWVPVAPPPRNAGAEGWNGLRR
jgi:hypothetical protein